MTTLRVKVSENQLNRLRSIDTSEETDKYLLERAVKEWLYEAECVELVSWDTDASVATFDIDDAAFLEGAIVATENNTQKDDGMLPLRG